MTTQSQKQDNEKKPGCYMFTAGFFLMMILFASIGEWFINLENLWPHITIDVIPFSFLELWQTKDFWIGVKSAYPIYIFGAVATGIAVLLTRNKPEVNHQAEKIFSAGFMASLTAGVFEEIAFRWLIFLGQIATYKLGNFLFFYAIWDWGIASWWHLNVNSVVVNWVISWPMLEWLQLTDLTTMISGEALGWAVGAAILTSTGKFRDAHVYHGTIGRVIVWLLGLYMFRLVFMYGLPVAMTAQFLYDFIIFTIVGIDAVAEKKLGWV